jgi:hypothetical protein
MFSAGMAKFIMSAQTVTDRLKIYHSSNIRERRQQIKILFRRILRED